MKVLFGCLFSAFLTGICYFSFAQTKPSAIQGKVLMEDNTAAEAATIVLLRAADSSVVNSGLADKTGAFSFSGIKPDTYLLLATSIGSSKAYTAHYKVNEGQSITVANIILKLINSQLKQVDIIARKPYIEVKPGKIIVNMQSSILSEGNSAYDILRQSPGVHVNSGSEMLSIVGRQPALITIDGKPTGLTGDDLTNLLRSMQSSTIEQIEMISSTSAKYDASGGGIINIILKKGKNIGANGSVVIGGGYGKYYKSRAGISFNNRGAKINIFGNYTFDNNKTDRTITTNRNINYNDVLSNYDVKYYNTQKTQAHNFILGADYSISKTQTIGIQANGIIKNDSFDKDNNLRITNQGQLDSVIIAKSNLDRGSSYLNYNVNYNAALSKAGDNLSADFNYSTYNRHSNEFITNNFYTPEGQTYRDPLLLENLSPSNIHIWTSKIDFIHPFSKTERLEAGVKYTHTESNNNLIFGAKLNNTYQADPTVSNRFIYTERISYGYLNYINKVGKFEFTAGLRAEKTSTNSNTVAITTLNNAENSNDYFNLFPQGQINYQANNKNTFNLSYNKGIHRPAYEDINPFLYYTDLYDYRSGNPHLKPEYTHAFQLTHTYNQSLLTTLYYNLTNDAYDFPVYSQNDSSKVNVMSNKNFGRIKAFGASVYTPVRFNSWWSGNFYLDASLQRYKAYAINGTFNKAMQDIIFNTTQTFTISSTISAEVFGKYESPTIYGINQIKQSYLMNAGISKQLFNKRGNIKLSINDIFNTDRERYHVLYQNVDLTGVNKRESRIARINFTYRFGKSTVKSVPKRQTGSDDEQRRTGN
ncbi:outer membrane beta-barrel family protein [Mucilaginibacter pineti]|nr:outer membrane beta-barrel family protein [Mucilaginibacter pineti]